MKYCLIHCALLLVVSGKRLSASAFTTESEIRPDLSLQTQCGIYCHCNRTFASCVEHHRNLTYIPKLPKTIYFLNFSSNSLENITRIIFKNISRLQLRSLCLRNDIIRHISENAFADVSEIESLDLSHNPIPQSDLELVMKTFRHKRLQYLTLKGLSLSNVNHLLVGIHTIRELHLTDNNFTTFDFSYLKDNKHMSWLDLSYNKLVALTNISAMQITILKLKKNEFQKFPQICGTNKTSTLIELDLGLNQIKAISSKDVFCLHSLRVLKLIDNYLDTFKSYTFSNLSHLHILSLDHALASSFSSNIIEAYAFSNRAVVTIYITNLNLRFDQNVDRNAFKGCTNLKKLSMSGNYLQFTDDDYFMTLLGDMRVLRVLILQSCKLSFFPYVISKRLINLERLDIQWNAIEALKQDTFVNLTKLTCISLERNRFVVINSDVFLPKFRNQLSRINFGYNPFACTCNNFWFISWLKKDFHKFRGYPKAYKCVDSNKFQSKLLIDAPLSELICSVSKMYPVIISVVGITLTLFVIMAVVYRYRWHVRHYIYMLRYIRRNKHPQEQQIDFNYDAFVLFCDDDFRWVRDQLMPKLEDDDGLKLCVHQRDFLPGEYIVDNIIDSLDRSRKVLLVLSNNFNKSHWCEFELALVQKRALEKQEGYLVVIMLENIETRNMTSSMYALLKTTTYIAWPEEDEDREMFWERLRRSIGN